MSVQTVNPALKNDSLVDKIKIDTAISNMQQIAKFNLGEWPYTFDAVFLITVDRRWVYWGPCCNSAIFEASIRKVLTIFQDEASENETKREAVREIFEKVIGGLSNTIKTFEVKYPDLAKKMSVVREEWQNQKTIIFPTVAAVVQAEIVEVKTEKKEEKGPIPAIVVASRNIAQASIATLNKSLPPEKQKVLSEVILPCGLTEAVKEGMKLKKPDPLPPRKKKKSPIELAMDSRRKSLRAESDDEEEVIIVKSALKRGVSHCPPGALKPRKQTKVRFKDC